MSGGADANETAIKLACLYDHARSIEQPTVINVLLRCFLLAKGAADIPFIDADKPDAGWFDRHDFFHHAFMHQNTAG